MNEPPIQEEVLEAEDGHRVTMSIYGDATDGPVFFHSCAMGVRAKLYHAVGREAARRGLIFATADPRGHGSSSQKASRNCNFGYVDMLADIHAAVTALGRRFPNRPIYLAGHSLGGQLSCLYASSHGDRVAGVVLVAACSVYWRCYWGGLALRSFLTVMDPILLVWGYFPGQSLGFAHQEARGVMRDWAYQSRTGKYRLAGSSNDYERLLNQMQLPLMVLNVKGDFFAPPAAVNHLCAKMGKAQITRETLQVSGESDGRSVHFSWAKQPGPVVDKLIGWLQEQPSAASV
ncbi:MAG: alpha/beta fold hydrolase [Acidobacteriota bacterium]|nr:alpha/beta fold hydrolase [Acidobacteriota bacterium]